MRCPACHENIRIQGKFCPKCGQQIFGLPVRPESAPDFSAPPTPVYAPSAAATPPPAPFVAPPLPAPSSLVLDDDFSPAAEYPAAPPSGPVLDISFDDGPTPAPARTPADAVGKVCPYCRFPIKAGEPVQICPSCGEPHHLDCWQENGGCTVYGCRASPAMAGVAQPLSVPQPGADWAPAGPYGAPPTSYGSYQPSSLPPHALALLEGEMERLATNALVFALLGFLGLTAVIGLLTGISVLGQIARSRLPASKARGKAWAAITLSVIWLVIIIGLLVAGVNLAGGMH
jgi:hypothetical protein